ncbi:hypothetical protein [Lentilactobacillus farraginis]|uniref:hypothetical protein n=1 Tax=Lentilactobacillus farraginis TaxID=390841 RepID=UPI0013624190|nr:hypothetical protein [Lentilactobacillus farraginis]
MIDRANVTNMLSQLVEKRLTSQQMYWSPEVDFDWGTDHNRRIDYVALNRTRRTMSPHP